MASLDEVREMEEPPPHPGEILLEDFIKPGEYNQTELAEELDISDQYLSDIVNGHRHLSNQVAIKLSLVYDVSLHHWLNLRNTYKTFMAAQHVDFEAYE